jgi:hypothetical protein
MTYNLAANRDAPSKVSPRGLSHFDGDPDFDQFNRLLAALLKHRCAPDRDGDGFAALCPIDATHTLAVTDGTPWVHCHGGCPTAAVLDALFPASTTATTSHAETTDTLPGTRHRNPVWDLRTGPDKYGDKAVPFSKAGRFSMVPHAFTGRKDISMNVKYFLTALCGFLVDYNDPRQGAQASINQIAEAMGCSTSHVEKMIRTAKKLGLIEVYQVRCGAGWMNLYVLVCIIDMVDQATSRSNETSTVGNEAARRRRIEAESHPNGCEEAIPTHVRNGTPRMHGHLERKETLQEDLSLKKKRDAHGARPNQTRSKDEVTKEVLASGFSAEEIQAGLAHPGLFATSPGSVRWAIGKIRSEATRKNTKREVDPGELVDTELEDTISEILKTETESKWRDRLVGACGIDNRRRVLATWQDAHHSSNQMETKLIGTDSNRGEE